MTAAGWIFMIASLALVLALNVFCFVRLLCRPASGEQQPK